MRLWLSGRQTYAKNTGVQLRHGDRRAICWDCR
jgi:hypothetical protein